jgi:hypothetical protein
MAPGRVLDYGFSDATHFIPGTERSMSDERAVSLHGPNGVSMRGTLTKGGDFSLRMSGGSYVHGSVQSDGQIALHGAKCAYFHGRLRDDGSIAIHGPDGVFLHGSASAG